ncbi:hypothetical protein Ddye_000552 [Dipteronia dyeriana]|uniref:Myb/SANT-like domain-containing protein n=1 Tax=Dipteronia dyeriana TaxID=168575 RepID=A0AAE0CT75_9ROSI|nr:hypothetical protein Ddye_000552 [Dipteronia dyeriana]
MMARAPYLTTLQFLCFLVSLTRNLKFLESVSAAISYKKYEMEKNMNKLTSSESVGSGSRGSKAIWDSQSVEIFCDLCIKEVEQGHRPGTHFTKMGWDNLVKNFNKTTGKEYNKVQLKKLKCSRN